MITRIPIRPKQVEQAARVLWDDKRDVDGRIEWDVAAPYQLDPYRRTAMIVLEAAIPQDPDFLREFAQQCLDAAEIIG